MGKKNKKKKRKHLLKNSAMNKPNIDSKADSKPSISTTGELNEQKVISSVEHLTHTESEIAVDELEVDIINHKQMEPSPIITDLLNTDQAIDKNTAEQTKAANDGMKNKEETIVEKAVPMNAKSDEILQEEEKVSTESLTLVNESVKDSYIPDKKDTVDSSSEEQSQSENSIAPNQNLSIEKLNENAQVEVSEEIQPKVKKEEEETTSLDQTTKPTKKKRKRKWVIRSVIAVLLVFLTIGIYAGNQIFEAIALGHNLIGKSKLRENEVVIDETPFTVLLLGTDQRGHESKNWRPDVIMVAAVNPKTKSIKLISLPRDLKVRISTGEVSKLNHSSHMGYKHNLDPVQTIRETIENFLNVPIDYYAKINFQGFTDVVDALGGVDVDVKKPFSQEMIGGKWAHFKPGPTHLDGAHALAYVRMRKQDPLGDMARNERQREVIMKLMDKLVSADALLQFNDVVKAVGANFSHNFSTGDIPSLAKIYQMSKGNIQRYQFRSEGTWINGGWYELWSNREREEVSFILQKQLDYKATKSLEPSPLSDWEEKFAAMHDNDPESVYQDNKEIEKDLKLNKDHMTPDQSNLDGNVKQNEISQTEE
ncbi:LCP family protein [Thermoflavimicrobium daqui]|uniref:Cell envelope-related transcriptional attenuator domain-containing protein n=1 Tax=Thermoflavimicrobium daqui TaxID=2137476 RepID=A0A364K5A9_9BACL|nr:LCP family protein [Thermoflavimicrobium daqui]RAL24555.1 hypothetical protein DL897_09620 [Thermoflavimicrobium daqui]